MDVPIFRGCSGLYIPGETDELKESNGAIENPHGLRKNMTNPKLDAAFQRFFCTATAYPAVDTAPHYW